MSIAGPKSIPATVNSWLRYVLILVIAVFLLFFGLSRYPKVDDVDDAFSDKIIVVAKLEEENTDWVTNDLAEYVATCCVLPLSESYYN